MESRLGELCNMESEEEDPAIPDGPRGTRSMKVVEGASRLLAYANECLVPLFLRGLGQRARGGAGERAERGEG